MAKNRIDEQLSQEEQKRKDNMRLRHQSERLQIEEAHLGEFNQFN